MRIELSGAPGGPTRKKSFPHDIIEFFEISTPLVKEGLTITEIAEQTGLKRTSIWKALNAKHDATRDVKSVPYERWRKGHKRTGAHLQTNNYINNMGIVSKSATNAQPGNS